MRLLLVAMADSVHTARWIDLVAGQGWDIHLFPSQDAELHPALRDITVYNGPLRQRGMARSVRQRGAWPLPLPATGRAGYLLRRILARMPSRAWRGGQAGRLARLIRRLRPDAVVSLEMQSAGYLTLQAKARHAGRLPFPPWAMGIWGSDLYLFGRLDEHAPRIRSVLQSCDYFACECERDVAAARTFGFRGEVLPRVPMFGGFDLDRVRELRAPGPTSERRLIMLKGYQGWSGRALVGLRALELCADALRGYRVCVYLASQDVEIAARLFAQSTGIPVDVVPRSAHEEILRLHGRARVSIALSISDGLPASFAEALVMGAFPVQSSTACVDEWIVDGQTGALVPPEDPARVADAIRRALTEDALVDRAAQVNDGVAVARLDRASIRSQVVAMVEKIASRSATGRTPASFRE